VGFLRADAVVADPHRLAHAAQKGRSITATWHPFHLRGRRPATNEILIEQNPEWDKLRSAAKNVLLELGGDIGEWERQQLAHSDT
jgi:hypothetical protein